MRTDRLSWAEELLSARPLLPKPEAPQLQLRRRHRQSHRTGIAPGRVQLADR